MSSEDSWRLSAADLRARFLDGNKKPLTDSDSSNVSILGLIEGQIKRGSPVSFSTMSAVWDALRNQNTIGLDDRKMLLEDVLVFMSRLPPNTQLGLQVERFMIEFLYKDLPHPPSTFLAPIPPSQMYANSLPTDLKGFAWREPDGSNNNPLIPLLGAAHTPYARSVASSHPLPQRSLPDPGLIFDTLLKRTKNVDHPTGLSSTFFAFANIIIHSLFDTNRRDWSINDTSSYLDLSPLYGVDLAEQETVRRFDGTGRIHDDTFADLRMLGMPPPVVALLLVFSRNHNIIAERILNINEWGHYSVPLPSDPQKLRAQDDEIFNRARLVNVGWFMQVILHDYVGCILRMVPDLNPWFLEALSEMRDSSHTIIPRGEGNACSVEFNLLYRWHATTSEKEEKWLDELWKRLFPNKTYDEVTEEQFGPAVAKELLEQGTDPRKWTFGGLKRNPTTNRFSDKDLAQTLQNATDDMAQAFRARGIPAAFKVIEVMGIKQARAWNVCSLNEFRKFLGLKPYSSFREWNPNPEISDAAERLYYDIDNLELFVGMQAEETRPSVPGSGLCSGYTMSRSILADAVALIRGDRFLTIEYTPQNLTAWGFQDVQSSPDNGSLGGMLTKLLYRAFPNDYLPGSIYAHFPFIVPARMRQYMEKQDPQKVKEYNWDKPESLRPISPVTETVAVKDILSNSSAFFTPYEARMARLTKGYGFFFGGVDSSKNQKIKELVREALFTPIANTSHAEYFYQETLELLVNKSYTTGPITKTVDIVREVINCVSVNWAVTHVVNLSLRTPDDPSGKYSEQELHSYLALIFSYVYLNNRPANAWFLEQNSRKVAKELLADITSLSKEVERAVGTLHKTMDKLTRRLKQHSHKDVEQSKNELRQMFKDNSDELSYNIFGILINCVPNWSHAMVHVVNFYLDPSRKKERDVISNLASSNRFSDLEEAQFRGYVREALRLDPPIAGVLRESRSSISVQGKQIAANDRVYLNLADAWKDENIFGDPQVVDPQRVASDRVLELHIPGAHYSLDKDFSEKTMAQTLRAIFSRRHLRRGPGPSGTLSAFTEDTFGTRQTLYSDLKGQVTMWPQSMILQYDIPQI